MIFQTVMLFAALAVIVVLSVVAACLKGEKDYWELRFEKAEAARRKLFFEHLDLLEEHFDEGGDAGENVVFLDPRRR